jgi:hypothetical protein
MPDIIDGNALMTLLNAVDAAGNGESFYWAGGEGLLELDCPTWNSASFKLQYSFANGADVAFKDLDSSVTFTANGATIFTLPPGAIRAVVTGTPTDLSARVKRIPS